MKTFWVLLLAALIPLSAWAGTPGPGSKADANTVNAGPTSGSAALPTYRTLVSGDVAEAVSVKAPVRVATTTSGTLATSFENGDTVDGVTLATGDRILVKDQASASENGIRIVAASGAPARATDADSSAELPLGLTVAVKAGTTNGGKVYLMTANADPVVVNTSNLTFTAVSGSGISDGDKGDITVSGTGSTFTIDNTAVTFAKIQNVATDRLVGRDTASSGSVEELTVGGGIEFTGSAGIQRSALTGDVTASAGSNSTTIASNAVTTAKILDANVTLAKLESRARPDDNILINGGFDFFQRGELNGVTTASSLEGLYYPDRWFWITNAGGVGSPTYTNKRVDASSEGARYGIEVGHSGGTNSRYMCLSQIVQATNTIPLRGRTVRFQARIKQASSTATWKAVLINWTGGADTALAKNLVNNWSSTTYTEGNFFTTNASYDIAAVGSDTSVGTSFTDVSVTGTVSSSANNLYVALFCITANHTNATVTKCGLYDGAEAREWLPRLWQRELTLCQQRYEKSYDVDTAPGTATGNGSFIFITGTNTTTAIYAWCPFKVTKPSNPTMRVWDTSGNGGSTQKITTYTAAISATTNVSPSGGTASTQSRFYMAHADAGSRAGFEFQWDADSEL